MRRRAARPGVSRGDWKPREARARAFSASALRCVVATGISFFAFQLRAMVSAAHFTVIGVLNKVLSVLLNIFVWEHHAGPLGICGLLICIGAGTVFQNEAAKHGR